MDFRKNFSERLSALRKAKGISLSSLGEHLSVTDEAVRLLEKGKRSPSFEVLCSLADYFDVPLDYLTGRGIFSNWEDIIQNKDIVLEAIKKELSDYDLPIPPSELMKLIGDDEKMFMRFLPALVDKIEFHDGSIEIFLK